MELNIHLFLLIYFLLYFGVAFVLKSILIWKRIGRNPIVLPKDDSTYGLVGLYFKITLVLIFLYVWFCSISPWILENFLPIMSLRNSYIQETGWLLLIIAFILTVIAQSHIRDSWRIGIDTEEKTKLITTGLFWYSRNPIFLWMLLSLFGLFLVTPDGATLIFLIVGYILIQIQVRLEEEFLEKQHGEKYLKYKETAKRFL